jgi:alkanesulfonate monooxygenase SsuD/methylene tetrahydromethanopterin reductase-like flavin-dependent oxidoreductase (luciferase family)
VLTLGIRYDFRNPAFAGTTMAERYQCAIEQCEWADALGFEGVTLSEHHGSPDGYLPSPLTVAAAIAARTVRMRIRIAALIMPLHDPLRIAEDAAVVDQLSRGRLVVVLANGYVPSEFAMFDRRMSDRPRLVTEAVETLKQAWTGEPFEFRGRTVQVTPRPYQQPRPPIVLGGGSEGAARRAARIADGFLPTLPQFWDAYRDEVRKLGRPDVGPARGGGSSYLHVSDDPDTTWEQIAPYAMHEMNAYGKWAVESGTTTGFQPVDDPDALRAFGMHQVVTPEKCLEMIRAMGEHPVVMFHPLMGGVPPDIAWENLRTFEDKVLPHLR